VSFFIQQKLIFLFLSGVYLSASSSELGVSSIKPALSEMLSYHVDHRELSPLLVSRSFQMYISRFDPYQTYLLQSEVAPYLSMKEGDVKKVLEQVKKEDYTQYLQLNKMITGSIQRARKMRATIRTELLKVKKLDFSERYVNYGSFPKSGEELYQITHNLMLQWLHYYAKEKGVTDLDQEERLLVFNFFEKKRRNHEDLYLFTFGENAEKRFSLNLLKAFSVSLDPHSMYFSKAEATEIRSLLIKESCGVGLELKEDFSGVVVMGLIPKGPASRSKEIHVGDTLKEIDDVEISAVSFREILRKLEGDELSRVKLSFESGKGQRYAVSLMREKMILDSERIEVGFEAFHDGVIGKISLTSFYDNNAGISVERDLREALKELRSQGPIYGLVLDLRKNAGGFLHQAVKTASLFIKSGVVVISKYANDEVQYTKGFDPREYHNGPIVLLTSKASASAAEIVAQALKDEGAAIIAGDVTTYGKGSMQYQTITDMNAKNFFKVTVGRYFTASGRSPQMTGVLADVVIPTIYSPYQIGERYLRYALSNEVIPDKLTIKDELKQIFARYASRQKTPWEKMIPTLQKNSCQRLSADKNHQAFLEHIDVASRTNGDPEVGGKHGEEDIQMTEAIHLIKDMIQMNGSSL